MKKPKMAKPAKRAQSGKQIMALDSDWKDRIKVVRTEIRETLRRSGVKKGATAAYAHQRAVDRVWEDELDDADRAKFQTLSQQAGKPSTKDPLYVLDVCSVLHG